MDATARRGMLRPSSAEFGKAFENLTPEDFVNRLWHDELFQPR